MECDSGVSRRPLTSVLQICQTSHCRVLLHYPACSSPSQSTTNRTASLSAAAPASWIDWNSPRQASDNPEVNQSDPVALTASSVKRSCGPIWSLWDRYSTTKGFLVRWHREGCFTHLWFPFQHLSSVRDKGALPCAAQAPGEPGAVETSFTQTCSWSHNRCSVMWVDH